MRAGTLASEREAWLRVAGMAAPPACKAAAPGLLDRLRERSSARAKYEQLALGTTNLYRMSCGPQLDSVTGLMASRELRRVYSLLAHDRWHEQYGDRRSRLELSTLELARTHARPDCRAGAWSEHSPWSALDFRPELDLPFAFELGPAKKYALEDAETLLVIRAIGDQDCDGTTSLKELATGIGDYDALLAAEGFYVEQELE